MTTENPLDARQNLAKTLVWNPATNLYEPDDGTIRKPLPLTGWKPKGEALVDNGALMLPGLKRADMLKLQGGLYPVEVLREKGAIIGLRIDFRAMP